MGESRELRSPCAGPPTMAELGSIPWEFVGFVQAPRMWRILMTGSRAIGLGLLFFAVLDGAAEATPRSSRARADATICNLHTATLRTIRRLHRLSYGPRVKRTQKARTILLDTKPRIGRGGSRGAPLHNAEAILNDTPAASIEQGRDHPPAFRPLGLINGSLHPLPADRLFSPKSPRAPPSRPDAPTSR